MYKIIFLLLFSLFSAELNKSDAYLIEKLVSQRKLNDLCRYVSIVDREEHYHSACNLLAFYGQDDLIDEYIDLFKPKLDLARLDKNGVSALHYAAYSGSVSVARTLIAKGCSTNIKDVRGISFRDFVKRHGKSPRFIETLSNYVPELRSNYSQKNK